MSDEDEEEVYNAVAAYICDTYCGQLRADREEVAVGAAFFAKEERPEPDELNPEDKPLIRSSLKRTSK